jgi:hypothetical protein
VIGDVISFAARVCLRSEPKGLLGGRARRGHNGRCIGNTCERCRDIRSGYAIVHPLSHPLFWGGYTGRPLRIPGRKYLFVKWAGQSAVVANW